ncbi:hypothetical protein [Acinetobacter calcoaceticus]|jgi:hypothetical protein
MKNNLIKYETSIFSEVELLKDIILRPNFYKDDYEVFKALISQNSFAKFKSPKFKIEAMSLNTHKHYTEIFLITGYKYLDSLRIKAYEALKNDIEITISKKPINKVLELEEQILNLMKHNLLLTKIIYDMKFSLEGLSFKSDDPQLKAEIKVKISTFEKLLSLSGEDL